MLRNAEFCWRNAGFCECGELFAREMAQITRQSKMKRKFCESQYARLAFPRNHCWRPHPIGNRTRFQTGPDFTSCGCRRKRAGESHLSRPSAKGFEKVLPVHVIQKGIFAPITPAHHMVNGSWILDSRLARRRLALLPQSRSVKARK